MLSRGSIEKHHPRALHIDEHVLYPQFDDGVPDMWSLPLKNGILKFSFILSNLNLNIYMWLAATILDSAVWSPILIYNHSGRGKEGEIEEEVL